MIYAPVDGQKFGNIREFSGLFSTGQKYSTKIIT